jgi:nitrite reductase/ring-hydroxylating ferredoxin subunit
MSDGYLEDGVIECPLHQARFDVRTGRVLSGPTDVPLATYPVRLEEDRLLVQLPGEG